jgi:hypothetical protein
MGKPPSRTSRPPAVYSEKPPPEPQPIMTFPLLIRSALPWEPASLGGEWVNRLTSETRPELTLTKSSLTEDSDSSCDGPAPSSNTVRRPRRCSRASCCHSKFVPDPIRQLESLPPSVQITRPVRSSSMYTDHVFRPEMIRRLPESCWIELRWKKSNGVWSLGTPP